MCATADGDARLPLMTGAGTGALIIGTWSDSFSHSRQLYTACRCSTTIICAGIIFNSRRNSCPITCNGLSQSGQSRSSSGNVYSTISTGKADKSSARLPFRFRRLYLISSNSGSSTCGSAVTSASLNKKLIWSLCVFSLDAPNRRCCDNRNCSS
jgi:hypothetical protein